MQIAIVALSFKLLLESEQVQHPVDQRQYLIPQVEQIGLVFVEMGREGILKPVPEPEDMGLGRVLVEIDKLHTE